MAEAPLNILDIAYDDWEACARYYRQEREAGRVLSPGAINMLSTTAGDGQDKLYEAMEAIDADLGD